MCPSGCSCDGFVASSGVLLVVLVCLVWFSLDSDGSPSLVGGQSVYGSWSLESTVQI